MSIRGFKVGNKVEKYDYNYLENIPETLDDLFKYGEWGQVLASDGQGGVFWTQIETVEQADFSDIPDYVRAEAVQVMKKAKGKITDNSLVFVALSDSHQLFSNANITDGNRHAGMAARMLAYYLPLDFATYLGDYTTGSSTTTIETGTAEIEGVNSFIADAYSGVPNFRTVGNHDALGYSYDNNGGSLSPSQLYALIGSYNDDGTTVMGSTTYGYCYRDFADKKVRVICLNTSEIDSYTGSSAEYKHGAEGMTNTQKIWFANALVGTPSEYGIVILSHHPLDYYGLMPVSDILKAFINGESKTIGSTSFDFSGENNAPFILNVHGHTHGFKVDNLHWNNSNVGVPYAAKRIAVPNTRYNRNNELGQNGQSEAYEIEFGDDVTYNKTVATGQDTSFSVFVINLDTKVAYVFNYGAGIDRVVNLDYNNNTVYLAVTTHLTNCYLYGASSVVSGQSYSATIGARANYELSTVTVTMGGVDITNSAYSDGRINISQVTGDVIVTADAIRVIPAVNIVPTATDPADATSIFDDVGYRNNVYYGYNTTATTAASGYVSTGLIAVDAEDIPNITAFYIRGANLDSTEKCKLQVFKAGSRYASYDYSGADSWADHAGSVAWVSSVEKLDDDYWRINIDKSKSTSIASVDRQIRFCVKGSGEELFISINNPIRDAQYDAWINA